MKYVAVYTRPGPCPERSRRTWKTRSSVPTLAPWMSLAVSPSPSPLSGSLEVTDSRVTRAPGSLIVSWAVTVAILWFGGHRMSGDSRAVTAGAAVSTVKSDTASTPPPSALPARSCSAWIGVVALDDDPVAVVGQRRGGRRDDQDRLERGRVVAHRGDRYDAVVAAAALEDAVGPVGEEEVAGRVRHGVVGGRAAVAHGLAEAQPELGDVGVDQLPRERVEEGHLRRRHAADQRAEDAAGAEQCHRNVIDRVAVGERCGRDGQGTAPYRLVSNASRGEAAQPVAVEHDDSSCRRPRRGPRCRRRPRRRSPTRWPR